MMDLTKIERKAKLMMRNYFHPLGSPKIEGRVVLKYSYIGKDEVKQIFSYTV